MLKTCPRFGGGFDALTGKCLRQILAIARLSRSRFPKSLSGLAAPDLRALRACTPRLSALRGLGRPAASLPPLTAPSCACGARPPVFNLCFCLVAAQSIKTTSTLWRGPLKPGGLAFRQTGRGFAPHRAIPPHFAALRHCGGLLDGSPQQVATCTGAALPAPHQLGTFVPALVGPLAPYSVRRCCPRASSSSRAS